MKHKKKEKTPKTKSLSKGEKKLKRAEEEKNKEVEEMYIDKILPVIDFDEQIGVGIMEDGSFCDCFSIVCKDLNSITQDELTMDVLSWEKVYKTYAGDLKIISFSFPTDTADQQSYVEYKLAKTANPVLKELLHIKQDELEIIHSDFMTREAALFFFSTSPEEYKNNYASLKALLSNSVSPLIRTMDPQKKKRIFFKMCNKNLNH